jgi:thermitase
MKTMKGRIGIVLFALLLTLPMMAFGADDGASSYHVSRVLVKFKQVPSQDEVRSFALSHRLRFERAIPEIDVFCFHISRGERVAKAVRRLARDGRVEFAEPDYIRFATYTPNDPMFSSQWDMTRIGLPTYWDLELGDPSVVVAVLDTGIDLDHPDLINQLWVNSDETPGDNDDDDGNGYNDDYNGYDFAGDGWFPSEGAEDPIPDDTYVGHGTHVSGTIAAEQDNEIGISGEAPGVKLMAVRVLGGKLGAGFSSDIAEGITYATDNGASVINMSLGGTAKSLTEYNALKYAWDNNVFIAAAAGNSGDSGNPIEYPAAYVFSMSVGAIDSAGNIATFSSHNEFLEVAAPGVNILSTVPGGLYEGGWSGTSMATPHVAGLAALLYSTYTGIENWQVRSILQKGIIDRGAAGWDEYFGYGRVDCPQILATTLPSDNVLDILTPPNGIKFRTESLAAFLWNPVAGAASYRITATLPTGGTYVIDTNVPYYTVHPSQKMPAGTYSVTVQARNASGGVIASDTVSFRR